MKEKKTTQLLSEENKKTTTISGSEPLERSADYAGYDFSNIEILDDLPDEEYVGIQFDDGY